MQIAGNVGYVIGRRGAVIKRIAADTGAFLKVDDSVAGNEVVNISGENQAQVDAAIAEIKRVIDEAAARPHPSAAYTNDVRVRLNLRFSHFICVSAFLSNPDS